MTNEEILKKVIEKAVANGFNCPFGVQSFDGVNLAGVILLKPEGFSEPFTCADETNWFELIFSHDFARAFWGANKHDMIYPELESFDIPHCSKCDIKPNMENPTLHTFCWQYHLQRMVLHPEPLKYIERYIKKEGENERT